MAVVVLGVLGQDVAKMLLAEDQHVVEAVAAERPDEPLREKVRLRRPDRRLDHPRAVPGGDAVERRGELAVPVTDQEPELARSPRSMRRLRACWTVQAPAGWAVMPRTCTVLVWISMTKKTYTRRSSTVSTCGKSRARMPDAWLARNCRQVGGARRGAGPRPAAARIRRIVPPPPGVPGRSVRPGCASIPQRWLCRDRCSTSARTPARTGGPPPAPR